MPAQESNAQCSSRLGCQALVKADRGVEVRALLAAQFHDPSRASWDRILETFGTSWRISGQVSSSQCVVSMV
jgi:hypothetical protein